MKIIGHSIEYFNEANRPVDNRPLEGGRRSASEAWRVAAAEVCGSTLLVLFTCLPAAAGTDVGLVQRALAGGLLVTLIVQCLDHVSGAQINPTVTVAAVLTGRLSWRCAAVMCVSQLAGATLGAAAARLLTSGDVVAACITVPASHISVYQAVLIEMLLGACLALANLASWDVRNEYLLDSWPLRIGVIVTSLSLIAGDLTGASMNPVRSFAPALCSGQWTAHWVYWVGPLSGSCVSAALYSAVWRVAEDAPRRAAPTPACTRTQNKTEPQ